MQLPEPILTYKQTFPVALTWKHFPKECFYSDIIQGGGGGGGGGGGTSKYM